jgi:hypothetical protein
MAPARPVDAAQAGRGWRWWWWWGGGGEGEHATRLPGRCGGRRRAPREGGATRTIAAGERGRHGAARRRRAAKSAGGPARPAPPDTAAPIARGQLRATRAVRRGLARPRRDAHARLTNRDGAEVVERGRREGIGAREHHGRPAVGARHPAGRKTRKNVPSHAGGTTSTRQPPGRHDVPAPVLHSERQVATRAGCDRVPAVRVARPRHRSRTTRWSTRPHTCRSARVRAAARSTRFASERCVITAV